MLQAVNIQSINQFSSQMFFILLTMFVKGFFVFTVMYLIITSFKERSAKLMHLLWLSLICSFIFIAVFSIMIPSFDLGVLRFIKNQKNISRVFTSFTSPRVTYIDTAQAAEKSGPVFRQNAPALFISRVHWSFFVLTVWFLGILLQLLYFASGKIGLLKLRQSSENCTDKKSDRLVKDLSQKMGINRSILLLTSKSLVKILVICMLCGLPFLAFKPSMMQAKRKDAKVMFSKEVSLDPLYGRWINTDY